MNARDPKKSLTYTVFLSQASSLHAGHRHAVGGEVVEEWAGQVVAQSLQDGLASGSVLASKAQASNHSQAAILQLLQLLVLKGLGVLAEAQGVECAAGVKALFHVLVVVAQALSHSHSDHLHAQNGGNVERHLNTKPGGLIASHSPQRSIIPVAKAKDLHCQAASGSKHGPSAVDQLGLAVALEGALLLTQLQGVKVEVSGQVVQVLLGLGSRGKVACTLRLHPDAWAHHAPVHGLLGHGRCAESTLHDLHLCYA
mmetsp:Transcript_22626/g.62487  ORF Transcript_22626/g.62487 Transcript_22626/m.62487 type:complete len:255 (+) Transcript_22626:451-1215(+)